MLRPPCGPPAHGPALEEPPLPASATLGFLVLLFVSLPLRRARTMAPELAQVAVPLAVPVQRMWRAATKIHLLMPVVLPDVFVSCDLDGDGGPGSIRVYRCGPAIQEGFIIRERVDEIDEKAHSMSYTVVEGDPRYKSMRASIRYVPSEDGATSYAVFKAEYNIDDSEEGFSDEITELISLMQTSLSEYLLANPGFE